MSRIEEMSQFCSKLISEGDKLTFLAYKNSFCVKMSHLGVLQYYQTFLCVKGNYFAFIIVFITSSHPCIILIEITLVLLPFLGLFYSLNQILVWFLFQLHCTSVTKIGIAIFKVPCDIRHRRKIYPRMIIYQTPTDVFSHSTQSRALTG